MKLSENIIQLNLTLSRYTTRSVFMPDWGEGGSQENVQGNVLCLEQEFSQYKHVKAIYYGLRSTIHTYLSIEVP